MDAILACHPAVSTEWLAGWKFPIYYDVLHLRAYLAALPTNPPEGSHTVWSRKGLEGCSGMQHDVITQQVRAVKYTLNSEPKALTGDKSEGIKSRGAAEAFIRGFSPVKAEGEEFNVLILSYTRELSRPFKENKG